MTVGGIVESERRRLRTIGLAAIVLAAFAAGAFIIAFGVIALGGARWIALPLLPLVIWLLGIGAVSLLVWRAADWLAGNSSRSRIAQAIEEDRALRRGALRGALEVEGSGALARRGASSLAARLDRSPRPLAPSLQRRTRHRSLTAASAAAIAMVVLGASRHLSPDGWLAMAHPVGAWRGTLLPAITIVDPPPFVLRGDRIELRIAAAGRSRIETTVRATGAEWYRQQLPVRGDTAVAELGPIDADLTLVATDGRMVSDTVVIRVTDRPFLGDIALRAIYPAYLNRPPEILPASEPARIPRGTTLNIRGRASTVLASAALVNGQQRIEFATDGHTFSGPMLPRESGRWEWRARGGRTAIADVPPPLDLEVVADSAPRIEIVSPASDTIVAAGDRVLLRIGAVDDHGLGAVVLRSARQLRNGRTMPAVAQRLTESVPSPWSGESVLELAPRELEPGDALVVVASATDNSPWRQVGESRPLVIRIPTLAEIRELARQSADSAVAGATSAAAAQRDLERRTADAARSRSDRSERGNEARSGSRGEKTPMSYEAAEQARALLNEQRQLAEQIAEVQRAAAQLEEQLRRAGALDTALAQRLREVQQLLRDALTPQLAEQLAALEEALRQRSGDDARQQLGDLAEQQRRLREQLERSAEMLKRAALEGMMETLQDEARELAEAERALADSLGRGERDANAMRELGDRSGELTRAIDELVRRLEEERAETGAAQARDARQEASASTQSLQRAREEGRQSEPRAAPRVREAAESMQRAAEALANAREQQIAEWKSELTDELDQSIQEMLQLARQQQSLEQQASQGADPSELRGAQSALQQGVEKAAQRLDQAGRKSSLLSARSQAAMGEARQQVTQATEAAAEGRRGQASGAMRDAADALNKAAASLVRDRERASRARSASGFAEMVEQMQELARKQGGINAQASGLLQLPSAQAAQMSAAARALANQQRALARELEDVGGGTGSGRAEALAAEARRIAEALESGRIDPGVLARQQQLFRRMLDAGRSLEKEERDDTGKREARTATGEERFAPGTGAARGADASRFREPTWDELRGLTADERRAVLEYFKRINASSP